MSSYVLLASVRGSIHRSNSGLRRRLAVFKCVPPVQLQARECFGAGGEKTSTLRTSLCCSQAAMA